VPPIEPAVILLALLAAGAFFVRGLTGAASAIVFNALFAALLAFGATAGLTLLDGLYWIALADFLATLALLVALRTQLRVESFVVRFLIGSVPVNVLATLALPRLDVGALTIGLGAVLVGAGAYLAFSPRVRPLPTATLDRWAIPFGAMAGVLGGLYGMSGPIAVLFMSHAEGDPSRFRARITVLALAWGSVRVSVLALSGAYTVERIEVAAVSLPFVFAGLAAGFWAHRFVQPRPFRLTLGLIVMVAGAVALVRTLL
jgi:uncharacterized membrane protein YfcA